MEYVNYLVIALLLFFMLKKFVPAKGVKHINTTELKTELNDRNKQLVDVRKSKRASKQRCSAAVCEW